MKVGFTGTQAGMTNLQWTKTLFLLRGLEVQADLVIHHGCCLGADATSYGSAWSPWKRKES